MLYLNRYFPFPFPLTDTIISFSNIKFIISDAREDFNPVICSTIERPNIVSLPHSLVRANYNDLKNDIHETTEYLELFLRNLLLDELTVHHQFLH